MRGQRHLALAIGLMIGMPAAAAAAPQPWGASGAPYAFNEGYERGARAGLEDARRGDRYQFTDESDYRRGDAGFRSQYGSRDRYRIDFRRGFEQGYQAGYRRSDNATRGRFGTPSWSTGGWPSARYDLARETGFSDGYEAGMNDGRARRRFDPISESRYRSADRGYERWYGTRESYKNTYREAFKTGYSRGYEDARRYR